MKSDPKELVAELKEALNRVRDPVLKAKFVALASKLAPRGGPYNCAQIRNLLKVLKGHNRSR